MNKKGKRVGNVSEGRNSLGVAGAAQKDGAVAEREDEEEFFHTKKLLSEELIHETYPEESFEALNKVANRTYFVVIIYDIVDNPRRGRLARLLLGYGNRVQYSGFEGHLTSKQIDTLTAKVAALIDEKEDKVRIYKIAGQPQVKIFGNIPYVDHEAFTII